MASRKALLFEKWYLIFKPTYAQPANQHAGASHQLKWKMSDSRPATRPPTFLHRKTLGGEGLSKLSIRAPLSRVLLIRSGAAGGEICISTNYKEMPLLVEPLLQTRAGLQFMVLVFFFPPLKKVHQPD